MAVLTWYINLPILECTADKHLVFAIRDNSASIPVDPTKLVVQGSPNCKPVIVNNKVAIFKFKVDECGVRTYVSLISFTLSFTGQKKTGKNLVLLDKTKIVPGFIKSWLFRPMNRFNGSH